jgi:hypothetical protein
LLEKPRENYNSARPTPEPLKNNKKIKQNQSHMYRAKMISAARFVGVVQTLLKQLKPTKLTI